MDRDDWIVVAIIILLLVCLGALWGGIVSVTVAD